MSNENGKWFSDEYDSGKVAAENLVQSVAEVASVSVGVKNGKDSLSLFLKVTPLDSEEKISYQGCSPEDIVKLLRLTDSVQHFHLRDKMIQIYHPPGDVKSIKCLSANKRLNQRGR